MTINYDKYGRAFFELRKNGLLAAIMYHFKVSEAQVSNITTVETVSSGDKTIWDSVYLNAVIDGSISITISFAMLGIGLQAAIGELLLTQSYKAFRNQRVYLRDIENTDSGGRIVGVDFVIGINGTRELVLLEGDTVMTNLADIADNIVIGGIDMTTKAVTTLFNLAAIENGMEPIYFDVGLNEHDCFKRLYFTVKDKSGYTIEGSLTEASYEFFSTFFQQLKQLPSYALLGKMAKHNPSYRHPPVVQRNGAARIVGLRLHAERVSSTGFINDDGTCLKVKYPSAIGYDEHYEIRHSAKETFWYMDENGGVLRWK